VNSIAPTIFLLGSKGYQDLPHYLAGFDVALLPMQRNSYTRGVYPMKFAECVAADRPAVSVNLESLADCEDVALFGDTAEELEAHIQLCLNGSRPTPAQRQAFADYHTYEKRTERMLADINGLPARGTL
jgi:hypothetical protein